jgi:hypothetical protein
MSFDVAVTREGQHTRVIVQGTPTPGQLLSLLTVLQVDAASWPGGDVVLDLAGVGTALTPDARSEVEDQARRCLGSVGPVKVVWPGP